MKEHLIKEDASIREALRRLNDLRARSMTLFVVDGNGEMKGTLTDGDVRRAFISGSELDSPVAEAMHREFAYLRDMQDVAKIKEIREHGITLAPVLDTENRIEAILDLSIRKTILPIDAVLMAGGRGERLRPLTLETPKPLLKIGTKPIIDYNAEGLSACGIENITVTVNYLKEKIIDHFTEPLKDGTKVQCVAEEQFFGTIGALRLVKEFKNDTILVMNSDLLTNIDYEDFYMHFREHKAMMSAAAVPYTISIPYGIFDLEGRDIKGVEEKPVYNLYANAGIYLLRKEVIKYIPENKVFNATDLIEALAKAGEKVIRYPLSGMWIDIGTPEEYHKAQELARHL